MDINIIVLIGGFFLTIVATVLTGLGIVLALVRYVNGVRLELKGDIKELRGEVKAVDSRLNAESKELRGEIKSLDSKLSAESKELRDEIRALDSKLSAEIKEVRQASEKAHASIQAELSVIKAEQAAQSERLDCIEDKIDDIKRGDYKQTGT